MQRGTQLQGSLGWALQALQSQADESGSRFEVQSRSYSLPCLRPYLPRGWPLAVLWVHWLHGQRCQQPAATHRHADASCHMHALHFGAIRQLQRQRRRGGAGAVWPLHCMHGWQTSNQY